MLNTVLLYLTIWVHGFLTGAFFIAILAARDGQANRPGVRADA